MILDATFLDERWREYAGGLASAASVPFLLVETVCDEQVVAARIAARAAIGDSASDADLAIYAHQRRMLATAPVAVPRGAIGVRVDMSTGARNRVDPVFAALQRAEVLRPHLQTGPPRTS